MKVDKMGRPICDVCDERIQDGEAMVAWPPAGGQPVWFHKVRCDAWPSWPSYALGFFLMRACVFAAGEVPWDAERQLAVAASELEEVGWHE
jgi:hypothetical protein